MSTSDMLSSAATRVFGVADDERIAAARTALYVSSGSQAAFHARMWTPYIESVDPNYVVGVPAPSLFVFLRRRHPDLPVVLLKTKRDIEAFVSAATSLKAILYTSNTDSIVSLVQHEHLAHVLVGHGDSDKISSVNRAVRLYDEIWVAGSAQIDRMERTNNVVSSQVIQIVGRPVARELLDGRVEGGVYQVGHMPTWEGVYAKHDYSSLHMLEGLVASSLRSTGGPVGVKVHPWTGRRDKRFRKIDQELRASCERSHKPVEVEDRDVRSYEMMARSDRLVTDVSSVTIDYLLTARPLFTYLAPERNSNVRSGSVQVADYAYTFSTPSELEKALDGVAAGDDPKADGRAKACDYHIDVEATANFEFERRLGDLVGL